MRWFKHLNIRGKLILIILMVTFITVALIGGIRIAWDMQQAREALAQDMSALSRLLSSRSSAALAFDDARLAQENLASLQEISHVVQACLYRGDGSILAVYQRSVSLNNTCPASKLLLDNATRFEDDSLYVVAAVRQSTELLGWLLVSSDLSLINSRLHDQLIFSALALLAALVLAWLLATWLQRIISAPIERVTQVARAIEEQQDRSLRAPVGNQDEVGKLAHSFNAMLDALDEQNQQLVAAKVEQQVASTRYRSLVESTSAIPWELELNSWRFTFVGPQAELLLGYPVDDWYQEKFWANSLHPDDKDESLAFCQAATAEMRNHQFEYRMRSSDGNYVWIHDDVQVVCEDDKPVRLQGFMFDITERKRHEQAITDIAAGVSAESGEAFFQHLVEHLSRLFNADYAFIGVLDKDQPLQINTLAVFAHGKIIDNLSYSLRGTPCANVVGESTCIYKEGVQALFPQDPLLNDMGIEGYIGSPLYNSKGEPLGVLVVLDSKPLKRTDQAGELLDIFAARAGAEVERMYAQESVRKLSQAVEQSPNMVMITDADGIIEYVNPSFSETTGYAAHEVIGQNPRVLQSGKTSIEVYQELWTTIKLGQVWRGEIVNKHKDETLYTVEETIAPLFDQKGAISHFVSIKQDVTERKETEEALRRSQKMDAIGKLSGGIAHDFNNQLGVVIGYLDILKSHISDDEKSVKWVDTAIRASLHCIDLTRQLLTFSRQTGKEKEQVDINIKLKELETMVARSITPEVDVRYFLSENLWLSEINPGEFQDVILNLVINARDAMPSGGKLTIETKNKYLDADTVSFNPSINAGDYVILTVSDTGIGMDKKTLEHIFEPFFTTKAEGEGTGLGMAMVYGFVKRYAGSINVYSELGVGTTFRLYLPKSKSEALGENNIHQQNIELIGGNETILIVDDVDDMRNLASQYLTDLGYKTQLAKNAAQALQILEKESGIDLLFSDVVMSGGMNGYELVKKALAKKPALKALLTSGFTSKNIEKSGLAQFADKLLGKPYRKADLAKRIRSALDE